jgi:hypothetical protein
VERSIPNAEQAAESVVTGQAVAAGPTLRAIDGKPSRQRVYFGTRTVTDFQTTLGCR